MASTWLWPFNTTLPNPFLWIGNEPSDGIPFLYNWMGNSYAYRTNDWLDKIFKSFWDFNTFTPSGNDDYGQQSSEIAFFMLGLYPNTPYTTYALFAPKFSLAEIRLPNHQNKSSSSPPSSSSSSTSSTSSAYTVSVRLIAQNLVSGITNYLANASVNGKMLATPFVDHEELMSVASSGATPTIEFFCTQTPVTFGSSSSSIPPWVPPKKDEDKMRAQVQAIVKKVEKMMMMDGAKVDDESIPRKLRSAKRRLFG